MKPDNTIYGAFGIRRFLSSVVVLNLQPISVFTRRLSPTKRIVRCSIHLIKIGQFGVTVYSCDTIDNHIVERVPPEDYDLVLLEILVSTFHLFF